MVDHGVKVLLIDDDEDDALLIREWLAEIKTTSFIVDWAQTYQAAVETIVGNQHDVYLVDYRLGQRTGLEVLEKVKEGGNKTPVIMLTGIENRTIDEEAMRAGAADYLVKTQLNADLLERSIRYTLKHKQAEAELQNARDDLELRVQERTAALIAANQALRAEIAERQRAEQKLRDSERLATIGTTAAKLAHEIGNPLNGMATTVQIIERQLSTQKDWFDDTLLSAVQDLASEIQRLRVLLQRLRALVRPQQLTLQPTDLALLAAEVLRREAPLYSERHIKVESDFSTLLPLVMANSEEMTQVLLNLYKNAVEAMPAGGTLTVRGFRAGTQPCLEVSDTGEGIPEGVDILEPFVTTKSGGTGLGLAIVQQIIAAHGGSMSYTSIRGRGTTFTLTLPISPGDAR
jgi:signal transduction histidine kinase